MQNVLLVDADVLFYRFGFSAETEVDFGDDNWSLTSDLQEAKDKLDNHIEWLMEELEATKVKMCISSSEGNFRTGVYREYKANRKKNRKPIGFRELRNYVLVNYNCEVMPSLEADDVLGILATGLHKSNGIICSIDKDLLTIPGRHYNWDTKGEVSTVCPRAATLGFYRQAVTGDPTDNYPGCPGIGNLRGEALVQLAYQEAKREGLEPHSHVWSAIVDAYAKKGLSEEFALQMARCAYILHHSDYNQKTGKVTLWTPKK